jgi:hypothetical protein
MLTATYDLNRLDIFRHLNGDHYAVDAVEWVGGDTYAVSCIDNNDDLVTFNVDVHTMFDVVFTYKKEGTKLNTLVMTMPNGTQLTETCSDAELQDAIDGMAHYYFKSRIVTFTVNGVAFDEAQYCAEQGI